MWRSVVVLVGLAAALFGLSYLDPPWVGSTDQRGVHIVTLPCDGSRQSSSSGFLIEDGVVVTVAHALFESRDFAVRDSFGRWHRGEITRLDLDDDLAVLAVPGLRGDSAELAPRRLTQDWPATPVVMVDGSASGTIRGEIVRRIIVKIAPVGSRPSDDVELGRRSGFEADLDMALGDSGAALVDDRDRLVGVVFARSTKSRAAWATAATEIDLGPAPVPTWECRPTQGATQVRLAP